MARLASVIEDTDLAAIRSAPELASATQDGEERRALLAMILDYVARLEAASRIGANAAAGQATASSNAGSNTANILTDTAGTLGNLALGAGQSRASSIANTSSIISSGIGALADYYGRRSADAGVLSKGNASGPAGGAKSGGDYIYYGVR